VPPDAPPLPPYDFSPTSNLLSLLSHAPWSQDYFYASNPPPTHLHPRSTERWIFTSHDESIFEGTWNRYTYSPNKPGGAEVLYRLHSKRAATREESVIEFFGVRYVTSHGGDTIARRGAIIRWLKAKTAFKKMPRPTSSSGDWSLELVPEVCAFTLLACTSDSRGPIHKPLVRVQATLRGMEVLLFYDRPSLLLFYDPPSKASESSPTLMDMEMGLVTFVVLYFAKMRFEPMPPPPLPPKAQEMLMREFEEEMGSSDEESDDDDDYSDE
jgi:hypothetical protein